MPATKQDKVQLACPHCGHQQLEPPTAFSSVCKKCGRHFHVQEVLNPVSKPSKPVVETPAAGRRRISCFECGTELEVPLSAESTMCKRCSRYVDLKDYHITSAVSKNFKTRGAFVLEPKGYVFNTEVIVGNAVLKGKFLGKLVAEELTIYSSAQIKGTFKAARLIIPAANHFRWAEPILVGSAEIAGELVNDLRVKGTIVVKSTARLFGNLEAGNLVIEDGAVVVGKLQIGPGAVA
jgi:cytoskeletal protein CcmA (bactofilin family)/DNA-directed RNA polymerase subunit RPC12/RpoP